MKFKTVRVAAATALSAAALGAHALDNYTFTPVGSTEYRVVSGSNWEDAFTFAISSGTGIAGGVFGSLLSVPAVPGLDSTTSIGSVLFSSDGTLFSPVADTSAVPGYQFQLGGLSAGPTYFFKVGGTLTGLLPAGGYLVQAQAVPEPGTLALVMAGLGVVGFVARRRRPQ